MTNEQNVNSIKWCKKCKDENFHSKFHVGCNIARKRRNSKLNKQNSKNCVDKDKDN